MDCEKDYSSAELTKLPLKSLHEIRRTLMYRWDWDVMRRYCDFLRETCGISWSCTQFKGYMGSLRRIEREIYSGELRYWYKMKENDSELLIPGRVTVINGGPVEINGEVGRGKLKPGESRSSRYLFRSLEYEVDRNNLVRRFTNRVISGEVLSYQQVMIETGDVVIISNVPIYQRSWSKKKVAALQDEVGVFGEPLGKDVDRNSVIGEMKHFRRSNRNKAWIINEKRPAKLARVLKELDRRGY